MMKFSLIFTFVAVTLTHSFSQETLMRGSIQPDVEMNKTIDMTPKIGFAVSEVSTLKSAFELYKEYNSAASKIENYEIVIWGNAVKALKENKELQNYLNAFMKENGKNKNLKVSVCGIAMNKFEVSRNDLPKGLKLLEMLIKEC